MAAGNNEGPSLPLFQGLLCHFRWLARRSACTQYYANTVVHLNDTQEEYLHCCIFTDVNKVTVLVLSDNFSCVLSTLQCVYWRGNVAWATARPASKST